MEKSKRQLETKVQTQREIIKELRAEIRSLRHRVKFLETSRGAKRQKIQLLRDQMKASKRLSGSPVRQGKCISGHQFDSKMVSLCICLFVFGGCSLRGIRRVLLCIELEMGMMLGVLPSKSSISNWVQKYGYYRYAQGCVQEMGEYCIIIDESMVFGQERVMVALGVPAQKTGNEALRISDVQVLDFAVGTSWKWFEVRDFLQEVQRKVGTKAVYLVCDGGENLKKGVGEAGIERISDVGHEICKFADQTYRDDERFKVWVKEVAKVRFQVYMTDMAYLLPPKQRKVARFTNLSHAAKWSVKILNSMSSPNEKEQKTYGWLKAHEGFTKEFGLVFELNESIMAILKNKGISHQNIEECTKLCQKAPKEVPQKHKDKLIGYLTATQGKLKSKETRWNASSDVIESLFGKFKATAPDNPLNGITARILNLCLFTGANCLPGTQMEEDVKKALESIPMSKLQEWKDVYLIENQLNKRKKTLKN